MKKIIGLALLMVLLLSFNAASRDIDLKTAQTFDLKAKYTYIRSYPNGSGIFIVYIEPDNEFSGNVFLNMVAPEGLNAKLTKEVLDRGSLVTEITVNPSSDISPGTNNITLAALHVVGLCMKKNKGIQLDVETKGIQLEVEVFEWEAGENPNLDEKRDLFVNWLEQEHQEFGIFLTQEYSYYNTYPEILIVEHGTYLNSEWEMRVCDHVMIPPYDWSMFLIRKRGAIKPLFAAKRETGNIIHEIPVSDYPTFFGY